MYVINELNFSDCELEWTTELTGAGSGFLLVDVVGKPDGLGMPDPGFGSLDMPGFGMFDLWVVARGRNWKNKG